MINFFLFLQSLVVDCDMIALRYFTNGRGKTTTYIYNSRWELFELYLPDNSQDPYESFQYDEDGNLAGYQNALGQIIGYEYDQAGRLTLIDYPTGTDTSISYDDAGRVTSVSDLSGTTSWAYNEAYELIALSTPQGGLEYEYDNLGRLWKLIKNTTQVTEYEYDDASRLVSVLNPYNELTEFEYDDDSKLIRKLFANGTKEEYSYDERNRLLGIVLKKSNNDVLSSHEYVYDAVSNIIARDDNGTVTEFAYDLIDQLLTETKQGYSAEYTYDANGNRLTRTVNNVTEDYEYDDADKLLNVKINNTPVKEYTYDDCGRLIEVESSAGTTYLQWDIRNRLTQITYPNSSTNTFGYNGFGARISKSDSTGNYTFLRNGTGVTAPVLSDSYAEYTPGISEKRSTNSTYYHSDIKNTTSQTNSSQNVSGTNTYDAFGNLIDYSGNWNGPFTYGGAFGYQTDNDSGLMLLGHRYYDASTGRFLSRDPIGDGSNWYVYCRNNPLGLADRNGLDAEAIINRARDIINNPEDWRDRYRDRNGRDLTDPCPFNPNHGPHPRYTDCGRFIAAIIRELLIDTNFPEVGTRRMIEYLKADFVIGMVPLVDSKWHIFFDLSYAQPGDFIIKNGHVAVVLDVEEIVIPGPLSAMGIPAAFIKNYEIGEGSFGGHGPEVRNYSEGELRKKKMNTVFRPRY